MESAPTRTKPTESPDLEGLLLAGKLRIPVPRPGAVSRIRLIERLQSSDCRLVALTAPAGYGKSTMLAEWASREHRRVAWVSLDRFDDDPGRVLALLARAYEKIDPENASVVAGVDSPGAAVLGRAAPRLAAAFGACPAPFVLMLDDLHEIQHPACHDVLDIVVGGVPRGSQFVTASRFEQPHVASVRASGDAIEVGPHDLALDSNEAVEMFSTQAITLSHDVAGTLVERTEGWPVGLYLAALVARDGNRDISVLTGSDPYLADYLYREALRQQAAPVQDFLRRTAVLDQLCGPLCDAVAGTSNGTAQLRALEAAGLFTFPLDRRREWYRYHHLFREFLVGELRRDDADLIEALHVRAADWFDANDLPARATEHLLLTSDHDRAARSVARNVRDVYQAGGLSTCMRWFVTLGDDNLERYPPVAVWAGWGGVLAGDEATAERWAAFVDTTEFEEPTVDGTASYASSRAMLRAAMCPRGPAAMLDDGAFAVAQEPEWGIYRDSALWLLGEAHLLVGNVDEARITFTETSHLAARMQSSDNVVVSEAHLAHIALDHGEWEEAAEHITNGQAVIDEFHLYDYAVSPLVFLAAARLALHEGDLEKTRSELTRAMRTRPAATYAFPFIAVRVRVWSAKLHFALGDVAAARHLVREIDDILRHRSDLGLLDDEVDEFRHQLAAGAELETGTTPLTPAELRLLPYLQTHLTLAQIADRLFVSRNTVSSQVRSVYRKLNAVSRQEAVERAATIGLLG